MGSTCPVSSPLLAFSCGTRHISRRYRPKLSGEYLVDGSATPQAHGAPLPDFRRAGVGSAMPFRGLCLSWGPRPNSITSSAPIQRLTSTRGPAKFELFQTEYCRYCPCRTLGTSDAQVTDASAMVYVACAPFMLSGPIGLASLYTKRAREHHVTVWNSLWAVLVLLEVGSAQLALSTASGSRQGGYHHRCHQARTEPFRECA